jgi:hypothetical protein
MLPTGRNFGQITQEKLSEKRRPANPRPNFPSSLKISVYCYQVRSKDVTELAAFFFSTPVFFAYPAGLF